MCTPDRILYRWARVPNKQATLQVLQLVALLTRLQLQTLGSSAHVVPRLLQTIMQQEFWLTLTPPMNQCGDVGTANCVITPLIVGISASLIQALIPRKKVILRGVSLMQILHMRA